ncbi:snRNA-activating protein complex subunit 1-like [Diadema antillarum]|uniref:snRNA-activating protein complex subunit 1-like n=1 Tax=Diadema antillarum TaxID=105358 RepID=UPI003A8818BC
MGRHKKPTSLGLTQGLQRDVDGLLARFINSQSVRYEEFSRIWRELNFPLIFCGLKNSTTERTFAGEVFFIALKYLLPPTDLQRKIFGMYLLYGIYYTQPCKPPMKLHKLAWSPAKPVFHEHHSGSGPSKLDKIRVTKEHWDALLELYRELQKAEHLDAAYIFLKMRRNQIFHFVVHTKPMLYTRTYRDDAYDKWKSGKEILTATFHDDLLEQLHTIHSQYQEMKQNLGLNNNLSMKLVRDSMADYIVKRVHSHLLSDEEEEESEVEPEANPVQERAARIATLKNKSFSTPGQDHPSLANSNMLFPNARLNAWHLDVTVL